MKMLRMMCGVTRRNRLRNKYVRRSVGLVSIEVNLAQGRLRWFRHVSRKGRDDVVKKVWRWDREVKLTRADVGWGGEGHEEERAGGEVGARARGVEEGNPYPYPCETGR